MLHSTQLPASSSKYVPGSHAIVGMTVGRAEGSGVGSAVGSGVGITVGADDGAGVVGWFVGAWVGWLVVGWLVGGGVGLHVCVSGSASQQTVPRRALPVRTAQLVTLLERA